PRLPHLRTFVNFFGRGDGNIGPSTDKVTGNRGPTNPAGSSHGHGISSALSMIARPSVLEKCSIDRIARGGLGESPSRAKEPVGRSESSAGAGFSSPEDRRPNRTGVPGGTRPPRRGTCGRL